jgi:hypothetical protein
MCGGLLYEDDEGSVYCVVTDTLIYQLHDGWGGDPSHGIGCSRDEAGEWACTRRCPLQRAQLAMFEDA